MSNRVFIMGAGFSKPAGLPTSIELLDHVIQNPHLSKDKEFTDWQKHLSEIIVHIERKKQLNIEQFFDYAQFDIEFWQMMQQAGSTNANVDKKNTWLNKMDKEVYLIISQKQKEAEENNSTDYITRFASQLTNKDTVITFNYDTLVESAIKKAKLEWDHGLNDFSEQKISVLKMHGSIDWVLVEPKTLNTESQDVIMLYPKYDQTVDKQVHPKFEKSEWSELWRSINTYAIPNLEKKGVSLFKYSLGYARLGRHKRLSMLPGSYDIWEKAGSALSNADEVYVMGFSMTEYDLMCRMFFADIVQLRKENQKPSFKLTLIDPKARKNKRIFRRVFMPKEMIAISEPVSNDIDWSNLIK